MLKAVNTYAHINDIRHMIVKCLDANDWELFKDQGNLIRNTQTISGIRWARDQYLRVFSE
jgi:hypothetical protein